MQKKVKEDSEFVNDNMNDICASIQKCLIDTLTKKLIKAAHKLQIRNIAIAGGVSANSALRSGLEEMGKEMGWKTYIPRFEYCTDNAAMIAVTGYYKYLKKDFVGQDVVPVARWSV